ncbi:Htur_1727 family rSAM-partnered candidate RiPP [Halococcus dombrowskii]|uniref:Htur_1727 family rSAM-partnered candidate RiPP n=1 Tax=Halococcus dombrowskii TaxID=179637 RepID=A0AAV3SGS7_HALDO|nr:Htur_1727 family rSAM-partnered candidate RiPP [Halococcus dombrowskii]UOO95707.1 Htur_1727 family rSAM-partnered candidate RiPP [Halococcus dombrowskii]
MAEQSNWSRVGEQPRDAVDREWEIFVRNETTDPLQHVGSVSAPTIEAARTQATTLFGRYATDLWLCPAADVRRYSRTTIDERAVSIDPAKERDERGHSA